MRESKMTKCRHDTGETNHNSLITVQTLLSRFLCLPRQSALRLEFTRPLGRRADGGVAFRNLLDLELSKKGVEAYAKQPASGPQFRDR